MNIQLNYPTSIFWEISNHCNLECMHCYTNSSPAKIKMYTKEFAYSKVDEWIKKGVISFTLAGGEPILWPHLCDLIAYISSYGAKVTISSNGTLIDDDMAKRLYNSGLKSIQISIDGLSNTHELIRGVDTYKKAVRGIESLLEAGINVRVGMTLNSLNYQEVRPVTMWSKSVGVDSIVFFRYVPTSVRGCTLDLNAEIMMEISKSLIDIRSLQQKTGNIFLIYYEKISFFIHLLETVSLDSIICLAGRGLCNITVDGGITICPHIGKKVGNVWTNDIGNIWTNLSHELTELRHIPKACLDCVYSEHCRGGCKGIVYAKTNGYLEKDYCCFRHLV